MDDADLTALRIPTALRDRTRAILSVTDQACTDHLDGDQPAAAGSSCTSTTTAPHDHDGTAERLDALIDDRTVDAASQPGPIVAAYRRWQGRTP